MTLIRRTALQDQLGTPLPTLDGPGRRIARGQRERAGLNIKLTRAHRASGLGQGRFQGLPHLGLYGLGVGAVPGG